MMAQGRPIAAKDTVPLEYRGIWGRALMRAAAQNRPARILVHGHSHVAGEGAGTGANGLLNCAPNGFARLLSAKLKARGLQFDTAGFFGELNATTGFGNILSDLDARFALGSGWASDSVLSPLGGRFLIQPAGNTGFLSFTSEYDFTSFRFWYPKAPAASSSLDVYVDDVLVTSINQVGTAALAYTDINTPGRKISFRNNGSGTGYVIGVDCSRSGQAGKIHIAGVRSGLITNMANSASTWSPLNQIDALDVDLGILYGMTNDITGAATAADWKTSAKTIVSKFRETGEAVVVIDPPASGFDATKYADFATAAREIASETGSIVLDLKTTFGGSYAIASGAGLNFNGNHPSATGHDLIAAALVNI